MENKDKYRGLEWLTKETKKRFVIMPIQYDKVWEFYKNALASFWVMEEISMEQDRVDWDHKLTDNERYFLSYVLAFFSSSDGIVGENIAMNFLSIISVPEIKMWYSLQISIENIHSEVYSMLIDTLIKDKKEQDKLFNAIDTIPCITKKANWALKWMTKDNLLIEQLVAFAIVEGVFFSGSFCAIFWLKKRGLMPGLCFSNELISRDEGLHCDFACLLYSMIESQYRLSKERIYEIISEAVIVEKEFITEALPVHLIGMNNELMSQYIEFVADHLIYALGYEKLYRTPNPFDWMELVSLQSKTNFFERRVSEYAKAGVKINKSNNIDISDNVFTTDAEF